MRSKTSLPAALYEIGFRTARYWIIDHERHNDTQGCFPVVLTGTQAPRRAAVYGTESGWDTLQSLGEAGHGSAALCEAHLRTGLGAAGGGFGPAEPASDGSASGGQDGAGTALFSRDVAQTGLGEPGDPATGDY